MRVCLDSFVPMVVLLGEEHRDGLPTMPACLVVGGKHPRCLGAACRDGMAGDLVGHDRADGPSRDHHRRTRRGPTISICRWSATAIPKKRTCSFAVSSIREDDGAPTALLVTLRETTEKALVARLVDCLDALVDPLLPRGDGGGGLPDRGGSHQRVSAWICRSRSCISWTATGSTRGSPRIPGWASVPESTLPRRWCRSTPSRASTMWDIAGVVVATGCRRSAAGARAGGAAPARSIVRAAARHHGAAGGSVGR